MTPKELSNLFYLNIEIEREEERLKSLEEAATNISTQISGLPHVSGISDKTALASEIADTKAIIEHKNKEAIIEYNRIMRYIAKIDDSYMRQIITLRYIDGRSWANIAMIIGGNNTPDSIRMAHNRFLLRMK